MASIPTGLGGELSIELSALVVTVASSAIMLAAFLLFGRDFRASLLDVVVSGVVVGLAYYVGLRRRA